jgi:hypothetical protein
MDTHHNAHILTIALNPEGGHLVTLSRNGETSIPVACPTIAGLHRAIHSITIDSFADDVPLIVAVATDRNRASQDETALTEFATKCVRDAVRILPEQLPAYVAGAPTEVSTRVYHPRVVALPLPWAAPSVTTGVRVFDFTCDLATSDALLPHVPEGRVSL